MPKEESVFDMIKVYNGLIRAYIAYLIGIGYTLTISLVIMVLYLTNFNGFYGSASALGFSEITIFIIIQIIYLMLLTSSLRHMHTKRRFKFFFYFSLASYAILGFSIFYFATSLSSSSQQVFLSFSSLQLAPIFAVNCIFLFGIRLLTKNMVSGFLSYSSIIAIIFTISIVLVGVTLNGLSLFYFISFTLVIFLTASIIMTLLSLRRALR